MMQEVATPKSISSICIVGGGSAGWMAATLLSAVLQNSQIKISVIESPDIETIGVGESTVPSIMDFLSASQINLKEFVQATSASFKLGIRFDNWQHQSSSFFHPFGKVGDKINGFDFYQVWLKALNDGTDTRWVDHSPCAIMAEQNRFMLRPQQSQNWVYQSYAHALHLDAVLMARFLRKVAISRGVERIEATVESIRLNAKQHIETLTLTTGKTLQADFFIDCTGFKGLLINETLNVNYESWQQYLPCNRAVAVQTQNAKKTVPFTIATAKQAGWCWQIPLQHRTGNGYVFASDYYSDDEAIDTLLKQVDGQLLNDPKIIPFTTGKRNKVWHNNCLALGLAAGFVEPLESTAIHLIYKSLIHFIRYFPDSDLDAANTQAFNEKIDLDYQEVRDFIILHYCTSNRQDSEFWRWCQSMSIPESLHNKIARFKERGQLCHSPEQLFSLDSWCSIFEGMAIRPRKTHPLLNHYQTQQLSALMTGNVSNILKTVSEMPLHDDYIQDHCAASQKVSDAF